MAEITMKVIIPDEELEKAIGFMCSSPAQIPLVKQDYFPADKVIIIDTLNIQDEQHRFYHTNGIVASIINLTNTQKT